MDNFLADVNTFTRGMNHNKFNPNDYTLPYEGGLFWLPDGSSLPPGNYRLKEYLKKKS